MVILQYCNLRDGDVLYLSRGLNATEETDIDEDPGCQETEKDLPVEHTCSTNVVTRLHRIVVPEIPAERERERVYAVGVFTTLAINTHPQLNQ